MIDHNALSCDYSHTPLLFPQSLSHSTHTEGFLKSLEEDARERGKRRREREAKGREHKKKGNTLFRAGQYEASVEEFSTALKHTPWDVSLYTNRALVCVNAL